MFVQAENDTDKFLCYSCNNWLINWWSLQNKSDHANNQPHSSSNSPSKSERNRNEKRYTSKTEKENEHRRPNFPVEVEGESRPVLKEALLNVEVCHYNTNQKQDESIFVIKRRQKPYAKKYKCIYCKKRFPTSSSRREHLNFVHQEYETKYILMTPVSEEYTLESSKTSSLDIDSHIVDMLRKQGTLISLEESSDAIRDSKPKIHYNNQKRLITKLDTNEILLSFDSVITEAILGDSFKSIIVPSQGLIVSP